jgi:carboxylate-amine ligase
MEILSEEDLVIQGKHPLFSVLGLEIEYNLVNKKNLTHPVFCEMQPLLNRSLEMACNYKMVSDESLEFRRFDLIELYLNQPASSFKGLDEIVHKNILELLRELTAYDATLLPGGIYPQHLHVRIPFKKEEDFFNLHSSLRILLPIIPALAQATFFDRIEYNPEDFIPEVLSQRKISANLCRSLIPDFQKGTLEIRLIDTQECPKADLAIAEALFLTAQLLTLAKWNTLKFYESLKTVALREIFKSCTQRGDVAIIDHLPYLRCFGFNKPVLAKELWQKIFDEHLKDKMHYTEQLYEILRRGTLSNRLMKAYRKKNSFRPIYEELKMALETNQLWY